MFPGVDGFHWTAGHVIFLSLFFIVLLTIALTVASAVWQTVRNFRTNRAAELCWKSDFAELPRAERHCRHELAGRVKARTCNNAFDCRHCNEYMHFAALPAAAAAGNTLGLNYPADRFYHRGHTWLKPEDDGTVTIGLDDLAGHVVGDPDAVQLPDVGEELELNQTAWLMTKNGNEIRVRAPIEGTVIAIGGPEQGWYLKLRPSLDLHDPLTVRHLLRGSEVSGWLSRELERLQLQLRSRNAAPCLADGGVLVPGLMDALPEADWDAVLADTFLEP
jgi:hypothetical protein